MTTRQITLIFFLIWIHSIFGQAFKIGENLTNNPKHKDAVNNALTKMQGCMKIWYFRDKKVYDNTLSPILSDDGKTIYDFIQIKLAENSILVILLETLTTVVDKKKYASNLVCVTSYFVKYGEIDRSSIKHRWLDKKRIYPENNVFTEELWLASNLYLTIIDRQFVKTMVIKGAKEIELVNMGANFCN